MLGGQLVITGGVMSCTSTFFVQDELQPWLSKIVTERVKLLLQFEPAVTVTLDPFVGPVMDPFPEMLHEYADMPAVAVYTFPVENGHNWARTAYGTGW